MSKRFQIYLSESSANDLVDDLLFKRHVARWCRHNGVVGHVFWVRKTSREGDTLFDGTMLEFYNHEHAIMFERQWRRR